MIESITADWFVYSAPFFINHLILSSIISVCIGSFLVFLIKVTLVIDSALYFLLGISSIAVVIRLPVVNMVISLAFIKDIVNIN